MSISPGRYAPPMSEDGSAMTQGRVVGVVVPAGNAVGSYEPFSRQLAEMIAGALPDLRMLSECVQQVVSSGIGDRRASDSRDE